MSLLEVNNLVAGYGMVQVLNGISLSVEDGEVAVVLEPMAPARPPRCERSPA